MVRLPTMSYGRGDHTVEAEATAPDRRDILRAFAMRPNNAYVVAPGAAPGVWHIPSHIRIAHLKGRPAVAEIVLGFAASHGPTMNTTPDKWLELGEKDVRDTRFDFSILHPKAGIEHEIEPDRMQQRYEA